MIVVRVELWSAVSGKVAELARMHISNDGTSTSAAAGDYDGTTFTGRDKAALDRLRVNRAGRVENFRRQDQHVWNLVSRMLRVMGYR